MSDNEHAATIQALVQDRLNHLRQRLGVGFAARLYQTYRDEANPLIDIREHAAALAAQLAAERERAARLKDDVLLMATMADRFAMRISTYYPAMLNSPELNTIPGDIPDDDLARYRQAFAIDLQRAQEAHGDLDDSEARADAFERRPFTSDAGVRGQVIRELAAWARQAPILDSEGGCDIRYDVSDWLMRQLDELEGAP